MEKKHLNEIQLSKTNVVFELSFYVLFGSSVLKAKINEISKYKEGHSTYNFVPVICNRSYIKLILSKRKFRTVYPAKYLIFLFL